METEHDKYSMRTSHPQLRYYINFVREHEEMKERHTIKTDGYAELWENLTNTLNQMEGATRTAEEWKHSLRNWLKQVRHRVRKFEANQPNKVAPFEIEVLETFGEVHGSVTNIEHNRRKRPRKTNKENDVNVKFEFVTSLDDQTSCSNASMLSANNKQFSTVSEYDTSPRPIETSDEMDQNDSFEEPPPAAKRSKYSTDELVDMLKESLKEKREHEQKLMTILQKVGNQLIVAAEAISKLTDSMTKN